MRRALLLLLMPLALAQYTPPGGPTLPLAGASGGTGAANGHAADAPWICVPASASGTTYTCTPTLLDGTAIPASLLAAPASGQLLILVPDVANSGPFTIQIDGVTNRVTRGVPGSSAASFAANDLVAAFPYLFMLRGSTGRWTLTADMVAPLGYDGTNIINTGSALAPVLNLGKPPLSGTTGSIGGGALGAGACTTGTVAVTSSTTAMSVVVSPSTDPEVDGTHGVTWEGWVSTAGTVTVRVCAIIATTPSAQTYNVRVIQ